MNILFYKENINCKGEVFGVPDDRFRTSYSTLGHTTLGDLKSIIDEAIEKYGSDTEVKFDEHQCKAYDCGTTTYKVNVDILKRSMKLMMNITNVFLMPLMNIKKSLEKKSN